MRPPFWHAFLIAKKAEASDWATGYFQIGYFEQETYTDDHQAVWDVDFDADQIREKASSLPRIPTTKSKADGQAKPRRQDLPILPEPIAQAWMRWFKSQPDANQERAQQSALHMFPNHNLSRERVRDLLGPVQLGAPQKTAKQFISRLCCRDLAARRRDIRRRLFDKRRCGPSTRNTGKLVETQMTWT